MIAGALLEECGARLRGYFRARVRNLADAEDLAQETWVKVLQQESEYDPRRGSFAAFVLSRARFRLLRYFEQTRDRRGLEALFCELQAGSEEGGASHGPGETLGRLASRAHPEDEAAWQARLDYGVVVARLFELPCPPHQLVVFGLVWLLQIPPREIVEQWSAQPLWHAEAALERGCERVWSGAGPDVQTVFRPLRGRLEKETGAGTLLGDYYTGEARANIVHWWYSVMRVLAKTIRGSLRGTSSPALQRNGSG